ncbi:MAG: hypothetical protein D6805_02500 [Planctomycetota bacterium]|nr:MAG: hypothetical protein D6805_02500 [Planctomycetota bacterium]
MNSTFLHLVRKPNLTVEQNSLTSTYPACYLCCIFGLFVLLTSCSSPPPPQSKPVPLSKEAASQKIVQNLIEVLPNLKTQKHKMTIGLLPFWNERKQLSHLGKEIVENIARHLRFQTSQPVQIVLSKKIIENNYKLAKLLLLDYLIVGEIRTSNPFFFQVKLIALRSSQKIKNFQGYLQYNLKDEQLNKYILPQTSELGYPFKQGMEKLTQKLWANLQSIQNLKRVYLLDNSTSPLLQKAISSLFQHLQKPFRLGKRVRKISKPPSPLEKNSVLLSCSWKKHSPHQGIFTVSFSQQSLSILLRH